MKKVYEWTLDYGRMGTLSGVEALTDREAAVFGSQHIYFGEVLGKHSEVWVDDGLDLVVISEDPNVVEFVDSRGPFGHAIPRWSIEESYSQSLYEEARDAGEQLDYEYVAKKIREFWGYE